MPESIEDTILDIQQMASKRGLIAVVFLASEKKFHTLRHFPEWCRIKTRGKRVTFDVEDVKTVGDVMPSIGILQRLDSYLRAHLAVTQKLLSQLSEFIDIPKEEE